MIYAVQVDAEGVVRTAQQSNVLPDGFTEIDADLFGEASARIGAARFVDGVLSDYEPPLPPPTAGDVDCERDRRIDAGFMFRDRPIQSGADDRENIAGAKQAATDAKLLGASSGDLGWQQLLDPVNGATAFAWICADNVLLSLDADGTIALGYAAMLHKQHLIFAGRALKAQLAAGEAVASVADDALWA